MVHCANPCPVGIGRKTKGCSRQSEGRPVLFGDLIKSSLLWYAEVSSSREP